MPSYTMAAAAERTGASDSRHTTFLPPFRPFSPGGVEWTGTRRRRPITPIEMATLALGIAILALGCEGESGAWVRAEESGTREAFLEFAEAFPESEHAAEARARSRNFRPELVGTGQITVEDGLRQRVAIELTRQWKETRAVLDQESVFGIAPDGRAIPLAYFVPIELGPHTASSAAHPGSKYSKTTWIPPVNTFSRSYPAFGTSDGQLYFVVDFSEDPAPVRFGLVLRIGILGAESGPKRGSEQRSEGPFAGLGAACTPCRAAESLGVALRQTRGPSSHVGRATEWIAYPEGPLNTLCSRKPPALHTYDPRTRGVRKGH